MLLRMVSSLRVRGYSLVLIAAALWSTIGLFYRVLSERFGFSTGVIVAYRVALPALILVIGLSVLRPRLLHIRRHDWLYFGLFGSVGVAAFYLCYIQAALRGPIAIASVLLYTAPIWIALWAAARQSERLTSRKLLALALAIGGCALVANVVDRKNLSVNSLALGFGLLSGISYAAYSLWSAEGTRRGYHTWTVVAYSLGIGAIVLFAVQPLRESLRPLHTPGAWPYLLGMALGPTLLAPVCFTWGLRYVRPSSASILATVEPVLAALLGWLVLQPPEPLNGWQVIGGAAVLGAVIMLATQPDPSSQPIAELETGASTV